MFSRPEPEQPLSVQQIRYALSVRIAIVIMSFFCLAWSLLQWALATEQRFMVEGVARQFVQVEALVCAALAVAALLYAVVRGVAWLANSNRIRRNKSGAARHLAVVQRVGAYI
ncbi:hypothetical protein EGT07_21605 [Herbaspirillum sp. HC18]|nr:hypothetical protein EGT07_21605 [Herbaspirillum sp. HC18]